jgi:hypothetical protein
VTSLFNAKWKKWSIKWKEAEREQIVTTGYKKSRFNLNNMRSAVPKFEKYIYLDIYKAKAWNIGTLRRGGYIDARGSMYVCI